MQSSLEEQDETDTYSVPYNLQLITSIDYTDRGEAEWKEPDGDITDFHIKSTNAVIKLRYFFK